MFLKNLHTFPPSNFIRLVPLSRPRNANHLFCYCLRSTNSYWSDEGPVFHLLRREIRGNLSPATAAEGDALQFIRKKQRHLMQDSCILSHIDGLENSSGFIAGNRQLMTPNKHTHSTGWT